MRPSVPHDHDRASTAGEPADAADGVSALERGVLVIRWAVLAWLLALAVIGVVEGEDPVAALTVVVVAAAWVGWLTVHRPPWTPTVLVADLLVAGALVIAGARFAWLATVYPVTAALAWGAARGIAGGVVAGAVLGLVSIAAGALLAANGASQSLQVLRDPVYFTLAGGGMGFVATLLRDSAAQVHAAQVEQVRATERAARLTEREALGRQIHDSVLQALALVHKRGRELAGRSHVDRAEVGRLADLAAAQERTLRALILRAPDLAPEDARRASLRERLERAVTAVDGQLSASVTSTGDLPLPAAVVDEIGAAVDQALHNIVRHAGAGHAWVFAEVDGGDIVVDVRDDGVGFTYDEPALRAAGKYGLLRSIRGRVEDLGGRLRIDTAPGRGTELELRVPVPTAVDEEDQR